MGLAEDAEAGPDVFAERDELRRANIALQRQLARSKAKTDELVEATIEAARIATLNLGPLPAVVAPAFAPALDAEVALWDTGDWQFSKVTPTYDSVTAERRVRQFVAKAIKLTDLHRRGVPVHDGHIVFGGDMVEGLFNFPTQAHEIDATLFEQYVRVARLLVEVVRSALATFQHVTVTAEWGNHGRIGSKRDGVPRADNIDRMAFELARQLLADEDRLTWPDSGEDIQRLVIGNYRALVIHGDEIGRNGFASPSTIVQHVNRWRSGAYRVDGLPWDFRDVYMHHYHTHAEWPMANGDGSVFQTGSTESDNRYAGITLASQATPSQRVHFIDPDKGRVTAQYKVHLD